jgi:hypothetical protein
MGGRGYHSGMLRILLVAALTLSAAAADSPLFTVYAAYQKAVEKDDLAQAKGFLSKDKVAHLANMDDSAALSAISVLSPIKKLRAHKEILDGDDASLIVLADVNGEKAVGHIQLVREEGSWKILSELWDLGGNPNESPGPVRQPKNDAERAAIRKLRARGFPVPTADFLVMTAGQGDLEAVKLFVEAGYPVDTKDNDTPAIVSAARGGHVNVIAYLMSKGANVNATDGNNMTALMHLVEKCDSTPTILALVKAGAKKDGATAGGASTAQLAEWGGCADNLAAIR